MGRSEDAAATADPFPPAIEAALTRVTPGGKGLYLHGPPGVGKTIALRVLARRLSSSGCRVLFHTDRSLLQLHRDIMATEYRDEKERLRRDIRELADGVRYRVAVLDDLGSGREEAYTPWESGIVGDLVDRWYEARTTLCVASNRPLRSIGALLGERTVSRLMGMCEVVEFQGPDRRVA